MLCWLGSDAGNQGHDRAAGEYYEDALAEARRAGNRIGVARGLLGLGKQAWHAGQYDRGPPAARGEPGHPARGGGPAGDRARAHGAGPDLRDLGELAAAWAWLEQGLELTRELEGGRASALQAELLYLLGDVARRRGEGQRAAARYAGGLELFGQLGDPLGTALCLAGLAALAVEATPPQAERAARLSAVAAGPAAARPPPASSTRRVSCAPSTTAPPVPYAPRSTATPAPRRRCARLRALAPAQAMRWAVEHGRP